MILLVVTTNVLKIYSSHIKNFKSSSTFGIVPVFTDFTGMLAICKLENCSCVEVNSILQVTRICNQRFI